VAHPRHSADLNSYIATEFQARESAMDLTRHRRYVESGLMDFLFVSLF
jgi:hypothetical protein